MNLEDLDLSRAFLGLSFLLPGFVFIHIYSRYRLPGGKSTASRTGALIAAVIFSTLLLAAFDLKWVKTQYLKNLPVERSVLLLVGIDSNQLIARSQFAQVLDSLSGVTPATLQTPGSAKPSELSSTALNSPIRFLLLILTPFAVFTAFAVCVADVFGSWLLFLNVVTLFGTTVYAIDYVFEKLRMRKAASALQTIISRAVIFLLLEPASWVRPSIGKVYIKFWINLFYAIEKPVFYGSLLLVLGLLFIAVAVLIAFAVVWEIPLFVFHKISQLVRPPAADAFSGFYSRLSIPIIEIRSTNGILFKGVFKSMTVENDGSLGTVSMSNVLQYSSVSDSPVLNPTNRIANLFRQRNSLLTIPSANIVDMNFWRLPSTSPEGAFRIGSRADLTTLLWYIRIYATSNRAFFSLPEQWTTLISEDLATEYCKAILAILNDEYLPKSKSVPFVYRKRLRSLHKQVGKLVRESLKSSRKNKAVAGQGERIDLLQSYRRSSRETKIFRGPPVETRTVSP